MTIRRRITINASTDNTEHYKIGAVVRLTGLSSHTIRVWEKRYQAVVAGRSATDRRLYSQAQVDRLLLLKKCTQLGDTISAVANLDDSDLIKRITELQASNQRFSQTDTPSEPTVNSIAILGEIGHLTDIAHVENSEHFEIVFRHNSADTQYADCMDDIVEHSPDIIIIDAPSLVQSNAQAILQMMEIAGPMLCIVIYRFGNQINLSALRNQGVQLLKAPLDQDTLTKCLDSVTRYGWTDVAPTADSGLEKKPAPTPIFNDEQLTKIASLPNTVECECPHHIVELVRGLRAFEKYSSECVSESTRDAALHSKMQLETALARNNLEVLLQEVLELEGIKL